MIFLETVFTFLSFKLERSSKKKKKVLNESGEACVPNEQCSIQHHNLLSKLVFSQRSVQAGQLQNCKHHSFLSAADLHSSCERAKKKTLLVIESDDGNHLNLAWNIKMTYPGSRYPTVPLAMLDT